MRIDFFFPPVILWCSQGGNRPLAYLGKFDLVTKNEGEF
jgi:hypothetical protein